VDKPVGKEEESLASGVNKSAFRSLHVEEILSFKTTVLMSEESKEIQDLWNWID